MIQGNKVLQGDQNISYKFFGLILRSMFFEKKD